MANSNRRGAAMLLAAGGNMPESLTRKASDDLGQAAGTLSARRPIETSEGSPMQAAAAEPQPCTSEAVALPLELQQLISVFESVLTGRGLLRRRGEKTTYQNLTTVVERMTSKAFKLQHLQQIKHLYPEAFDWQYIRGPSAEDATRLEFQLLLTFDGLASALAGGGVEDSGAGRTRDAAARVEFKQRLQAWHQQATQAGGSGASQLQASGSGQLQPGGSGQLQASGSGQLQRQPSGSGSAAGQAALAQGEALQTQPSVSSAKKRLKSNPCLEDPGKSSGAEDAKGAISGPPDAPKAPLVVPCMPLPSKENAPRVGGSPGLSRGGSMGGRMGGGSPTMSRAPSAGASSLSGALSIPQPGGLLLPPKSPALSRLTSTGAAGISMAAAGVSRMPPLSPLPAGRPPPSPSKSGRPPPSPTSHGLRGTAGAQGTSRGASGSILDAMFASQQAGAGAASPSAATPTSHLKRKASSDPAQDSPEEAAAAGAGGAGGPGPVLSPQPGSATQPRRRRLMLADSPDGKQQEGEAGTAGAMAGAGDDGDLSPTMRARLAEADREDQEMEVAAGVARAAVGVAGASPTVSTQAQGGGVTGASPGVSGVSQGLPRGAGHPSPSTRPRNSLLARFMSEEAMQELRRNSESAPTDAATAAAAARTHATTQMPTAMDLLRAIYGLKGPVVKPHDEVVELMRQKSSCGSGLSSAEARLTLQLLVEAVPEYASVEEQNGVRMLRINRTVSIKAVRDKLRDLAVAASRGQQQQQA